MVSSLTQGDANLRDVRVSDNVPHKKHLLFSLSLFYIIFFSFLI